LGLMGMAAAPNCDRYADRSLLSRMIGVGTYEIGE
jgi:hypothetical protein